MKEDRRCASLDVSAQLAVGADYAVCILLPTLSTFKRKPNNMVMAINDDSIVLYYSQSSLSLRIDVG